MLCKIEKIDPCERGCLFKNEEIMKIAIIGTGYVGLPTGVGLAEFDNQVICVDKERSKIEQLKQGKVTLFEEGLEELFLKNLKEGRLSFTTNIKEAIPKADVVLIAVGTPPNPKTKEADLKYIYAAAEEIAPLLSDFTVVATKSTVPVGTGDKIEALIKQKNPKADVEVISLPEFLREGFAIYDFFHPDRIVIGANAQRGFDRIKKMYAPFEGKTNFLCVSRRSSETIKYASNAFLAMKIHYANELADFCEKAGAIVSEVTQGMGLDTRIGSRFLNAGPGYGGSCFPKDTNAMAYMGRQYGADLSLVAATIKGNALRKKKMAERILAQVEEVKNPKVAVLGLAFKGGTDDCRESPAIDIIQNLLELRPDIQIKAYDPKATEQARKILGDKIIYETDMYKAAEGADVLAVLTEWVDFKSLDLEKTLSLMEGKKIVDLRNMLSFEKATQLGFKYSSIGRV